MNKQEVIDELAKYVKRYENGMDEYSQGRYGAYKVSLKLAKRLNEQNITDKQAWDKVAEAYPESAQSLRNTLDNAVFGRAGEPQKPVVPKFVADLVDWTVRANGAPCDVIREFQTKTPDIVNLPETLELEKLDEYFAKAYGRYDFEKACFVGYEVEKEPLYYVDFINDGDVHKRLVLDHENGKYTIANWSNNLIGLVQEMFTEEEIKSVDERYLPFAVPVKDVAEG